MRGDIEAGEVGARWPVSKAIEIVSLKEDNDLIKAGVTGHWQEELREHGV